MRQSVSVLIPCYNDAQAFSETLQSIASELWDSDEIIVVDSSDDPSTVQSLLAGVDVPGARVKVIWTPPKGVYEAFNIGLDHAEKEWIQILNSGDCYVRGGRHLISDAVNQNLEMPVHVFGQIAVDRIGGNYSYFPSDSGVWPTQSVICKREVHSTIGEFSTAYRIISDQLYFAEIRKRFAWVRHAVELTTYDLDGLSAGVSLSISKEMYVMWRALGRGAFGSFLRSYVFPRLRIGLTRIFGKKFVVGLKKALWIFPDYSRGKDI